VKSRILRKQSPAREEKVEIEKEVKKKCRKMIEEKLVILSEGGKVPQRGTPYSAGKDLYTPTDVVILPHQTVVVKTGVAIQWNNSEYFLKIEDKSSMALKGIFVKGGIVDYDYRKEIGVILYNSTDQEFHLKAGQKCAQYIYMKIAFTSTEQVEKLDECVESNRNGGFGSTGAF
jgi:dUTP pyrophosphatase